MEDVTIKMFPMKKNKIKKDAINHYKNLSEKKKGKRKKNMIEVITRIQNQNSFLLSTRDQT